MGVDGWPLISNVFVSGRSVQPPAVERSALFGNRALVRSSARILPNYFYACTYVFTRAVNEQAILDALRERHTVAVT